MSPNDGFLAALAIVSGLSGLLLAWLTHRRETTSIILQATSSLIADFDKVRLALSQENERLSRQVERLQKDLLNETARRVALEERLDIERKLFDKRLAENERRLRELTAVVNGTAVQSKTEGR